MSKKFIPSAYQQAIFDFISNGTGNAVINAVAGSGKTTTIVKALELIPTYATVYFMAFGKAIADEIRTRVPTHINVSTFHSLGAKALYKFRGSEMNEKRVYDIVANLKEEWFQNDEDGLIDADYLMRVRKLVDLSRLNCATFKELPTIAQKHGLEIVNGEIDKTIQVLHVLGNSPDTHDFVDMLYVPASNADVKLPLADWIFVDECQDLNKAQQTMLAKMMHAGTRFIAVGDPRQAIYGFAGADAESFETLKAFPNTIELPLSVNYRCGSAIIDEVVASNPSINILAHEGALPGIVSATASFKEIEDGDMVLCRNTAPLVKLCMQFIKMHKKAYIKGGDIGKQLANMVIRSKAQTLDAFEVWLGKELKVVFNRLSKSHPKMAPNEIREETAYMVMQEKIEVFTAIIDSAELTSTNQLINWIGELFADNKKGICFSTVHKAKGLEAERVFIIDFMELMPAPYAKQPWQQVQEQNLIYVAQTRAKMYFGYIADWHYSKKRK